MKYSREERQEIIDKYYPRYEYAKGGGVIQEYFEKYNQKMSGASEQTATYWVDGIEELSINEKKKLFEMISLKEKNSY